MTLRHTLDALWRTLAATALSAALGVGAFSAYRWAVHAPLFSLRQIRVLGLVHASESDLLARAGLHLGENVFQLDLLRAERAIETNPWIIDARLEHEWPASLRIDVREHTPRALVRYDDALYALDAQGILFKRATAADGLALPEVSGLQRGGVPREIGLSNALRFLDDWTAQGFPLSELSRVQFEDGGALTLQAKGQEIRLPAQDWPLALRRLASMRNALAKRGEEALKIDLDNSVRPAEAAATLAEKR